VSTRGPFKTSELGSQKNACGFITRMVLPIYIVTLVFVYFSLLFLYAYHL
jgi:hypothetical protein